jgi:O-antigen/teichoic acid export membrane protein
MSSIFKWMPNDKVVKGQVIATFLVQGFGLLLIFAQHFLLARWLGVEGFGKLSYGLSIINILAILAGIGFPALVLRFIPEYTAKSDWGQLARFLKFIGYATVMGSLVITFLFAIIAYYSRGTGAKGEVLLFTIPLLLPLAFVTLKQETLRAFKSIQLSQIPSVLIRPLLIILGSLYILAIGRIQPEFIFLIFALTNIIIWIILDIFVSKVLFKNNIQIPASVFPEKKDSSMWLGISMPLLGIFLVSYMQNQIDLIIVGMTQTAASTGLYSLAMKLALLVPFPLVVANTVFAPRFAAYFATQELRQLQALVYKITLVITSFSLAIMVTIFLFAPWILGLFGEGYLGAYLPMGILIIGQIVNVGAGPVGYLADLSGLQTMSFVARLVTLFLAVALYLIFIPQWGILGAAIVTSLTTMLWNVWLHEIVRKKHGIKASFFWAVFDLFARRRDNFK